MQIQAKSIVPMLGAPYLVQFHRARCGKPHGLGALSLATSLLLSLGWESMRFGCPILATSLFLSLGWENTMQIFWAGSIGP